MSTDVVVARRSSEVSGWVGWPGTIIATRAEEAWAGTYEKV